MFSPIVKESEIEEMHKDEAQEKAKGKGFNIITPRGNEDDSCEGSRIHDRRIQ